MATTAMQQPHTYGESGGLVLLAAIDCDAQELKRLLATAMADPNETDAEFRNTPLIEAATGGATDCVQLLLEANSQVDLQNKHGNTALHEACLYGHHKCVRQLLLAHAKTSIKNRDGDVPLHLAASAAQPKCMEYLIWSGADPKAARRNGDDALDIVQGCAEERTRTAMLDALNIAVGRPEELEPEDHLPPHRAGSEDESGCGSSTSGRATPDAPRPDVDILHDPEPATYVEDEENIVDNNTDPPPIPISKSEAAIHAGHRFSPPGSMQVLDGNTQAEVGCMRMEAARRHRASLQKSGRKGSSQGKSRPISRSGPQTPATPVRGIIMDNDDDEDMKSPRP